MNMHQQDEFANLPNHVGIILDGNRRWAKAKGLPTLEGHRQGSEVFKVIALAAFARGVKYLSAFVFSSENWSRTEEEVSYLMNLVLKAVERYLDEFHKEGIKIVVLGRRDGLRQKVLDGIKKAESKTAQNTKGTLALCFNYSGRKELVDAVQAIISQKVSAQEVTPKSISQSLYKPSIPDLDLLIRTSGEQRTSGFMMWRAEYAELYFSDKLWPDFNTQDLDEALSAYALRQRRHGV